MKRRNFLTSVALGGPLSVALARGAESSSSLRIAAFEADVTPPVGSPLLMGLLPPAKEILDPLSARGIVLLADGLPIVLCAVDWTMLSNGSHKTWCESLAKAVGTTADRVAVHCVHQHNAPGADESVEKILAEYGHSGTIIDLAFARDALQRVAGAAAESVKRVRRVTHIGCGMGKVEAVASTRRVLTPDGKLKFWRGSRGGSAEMQAAPEGLIDPYVRLLSFWDGDRPLVSLTYYACHPCATYGFGQVSSEIMGLARAARQAALPEVAHIHFNGAAGDIAVGKYSDNTLAARARLTKRLAAGMKLAWEAAEKTPVTAAEVNWRVRPVLLPLSKSINEARCLKQLEARKKGQMFDPAWELVSLRRYKAKGPILLSCLRVGPARVLHLPGEPFVAYQFAAQNMRPDDFVCTAGYGDHSPVYIGTKIAYSQGGYEVTRRSHVAPEVEGVLVSAIGDLLGFKTARTVNQVAR